MAEGEMQAVSIAHSSLLLKVAETHPRFINRGTIVMSLIESYGLLNHPQLHVVSPVAATVKELTSFHSKDYIQQLQKTSTDDDSIDNEQYGLGYDCPVFPGLFSYVCYITGASLTMADCLISNKSRVAINWYGGWHHGKKDEASGFCYCNDIVLVILRLLSRFKHILYIDLDIHHCDGVQEAFEYSSSVLTLSLHKYCPGFFPGTGSETDIGSGSGQYYSINIPLSDGITDDQYTFIFKSVVNKIHQCYCPDVLVIQCGADCLAGDPLGTFNVTLTGIGECVREVLQWGLPTLLLGGGGYHFTNTAKCWTYLTGMTIGETLSLDIPEHEYFTSYGPSYLLDIDTINRPSKMTSENISKLLDSVQQKLEKISAINL